MRGAGHVVGAGAGQPRRPALQAPYQASRISVSSGAQAAYDAEGFGGGRVRSRAVSGGFPAACDLDENLRPVPVASPEDARGFFPTLLRPPAFAQIPVAAPARQTKSL